jgi:putative ABC transport system permease protein
MLQDLRHTLRGLASRPAFAAITAFTLALGIGSTSAVFTLVEGVLLTRPPYQEPDRLVVIPAVRPDGPDERLRGWAPSQLYAWREQAVTMESLAAYNWNFDFIVGDDSAEPVQGLRVGAGYFETIGVEPELGRAFLDSELQPGGAAAVVISHDLWANAFESDPQIIGKPIRMRGAASPVIVGVMPEGIRLLPSPTAAGEPNYDENALVEFWLPLVVRPQDLDRQGLNVIGRLRPGASLAEAQVELAQLTQRQVAEKPDFAGMTPNVESLSDYMNRGAGGILWPLFGAAGLVLLIACGNAAVLLLVRGMQRRHEYAVRSALGVKRVALFRQAASEGLVLALIGGGVGVLMGLAIVEVFKLIASHAVPRLDAVTIQWPVFAWSLGAAFLSAAVAGLFPALYAARTDPANALKNAGTKSSIGLGERRVLGALTTFQAALTLVLLVGAGLLIRTMVNLANVPSGFASANVLTMSVTAVEGSWGDFHRTALERIAAIPGVERVAFGWGVPLTGNSWPVEMEIEGLPVSADRNNRVALPVRAVTPDYFDLLGVGLLTGREFRPTDDNQAPNVALVNQAFVDRFFPGGIAVDKKLWFNGMDRPPSTIVGVVADMRADDLSRTAEPQVYLPLWQATAFSKHLLVRTTSNPESVATAIQSELHAINPAVAVEHVQHLDEIRDASLASRTFAAQLLIAFAAAACVLTLVGVYGVLALSVASRRREIAIRSAVGARENNIRRLVFQEGMRLVGLGAVAGIIASILLSRTLAAFLFAVEPTDPLVLAGVLAAFLFVVLLACWAPTRRALKIAPAEALRTE